MHRDSFMCLYTDAIAAVYTIFPSKDAFESLNYVNIFFLNEMLGNYVKTDLKEFLFIDYNVLILLCVPVHVPLLQ